MKTFKFIISAALVFAVSILVFSCSKADTYTPPDTSADYKINIRAAQFDPSTLTMMVGTKVTFTNLDTNVHSVVSDDGISFNSGNISAGGSFSFTPTANGTYNYHCGVHPTVQGIIYVVSR